MSPRRFALRRREAVNCLAVIGLTPYPGLCRGENDEGKSWGNVEGSKGKQKSRRAVGLAGRELYLAECGY